MDCRAAVHHKYARYHAITRTLENLRAGVGPDCPADGRHSLCARLSWHHRALLLNQEPNNMENPNNSLMKFLLKLFLVFIVGGGLICGIGYLIMMAMFNW
jgi:hypothetical protein